MKSTLPAGFLWGFAVALLFLSVVPMLCLVGIGPGAICDRVVSPVWPFGRTVRRLFGW